MLLCLFQISPIHASPHTSGVYLLKYQERDRFCSVRRRKNAKQYPPNECCELIDDDD